MMLISNKWYRRIDMLHIMANTRLVHIAAGGRLLKASSNVPTRRNVVPIMRYNRRFLSSCELETLYRLMKLYAPAKINRRKNRNIIRAAIPIFGA
jgi:hypothetical protein